MRLYCSALATFVLKTSLTPVAFSDGTIEPGRVFDRVVPLDKAPDGYRAMNGREAIKVMVKP